MSGDLVIAASCDRCGRCVGDEPGCHNGGSAFLMIFAKLGAKQEGWRLCQTCLGIVRWALETK